MAVKKTEKENIEEAAKVAAEGAENTQKTDTPPTTEELEKKIAELEEALKSKEDQYLRMAAEYENFRRRSKEEREAAYNDAAADTVGEILPIIDNLERAALYEDCEKVKDGLVMIAKSVSDVFEKLGVEAMGAPGEAFDPNYHNAVLHAEDESLGENEITDVFQKGYKKGNRIIRFAMVKVVN